MDRVEFTSTEDSDMSTKKKAKQANETQAMVRAADEACQSIADRLSIWADYGKLDEDSEQEAASDYRTIGELLKGIEAQRVKLTKPLNFVKKEIDTAAKKHRAPLENAQEHLKPLLMAWQNEVRKAELRKVARKAKRAENRGEGERADDMRTQAMSTQAMSSGLGTRSTRKAEVRDMKAFCKAIAAGKVSADLVDANMPALNRLAKMAKKDEEFMPGVVAVDAEHLSR